MNVPKLSILLALATLPVPAFALAIQVNGVCYVGNCASPDLLSIGQTITTPFNFLVPLGNGDVYQISGKLSSTRTTSGITSSGFRVVTFMGNSQPGNLSPTQLPDSFSVQFLQGNTAPTMTSLRLETEQANFTFSSGNVSRTNAAFIRNVNGVALPRVGPFSPPSGGGSANVFVLFAIGQPFLVNSIFFYNFGVGTPIGSSITEDGTPSASMGSTGSSGAIGSLCVADAYEGGGGTGSGISQVERSVSHGRTAASPGTSSGSAASGCSVYVCFDGGGGTGSGIIQSMRATRPNTREPEPSPSQQRMAASSGSPSELAGGGCSVYVCADGGGGVSITQSMRATRPNEPSASQQRTAASSSTPSDSAGGDCSVYVCYDGSGGSGPGIFQNMRATRRKTRDGTSSGELQGVSPGCTVFNLDPDGSSLFGSSTSGPVFDPGENTNIGYTFNVQDKLAGTQQRLAIAFYEVNGVNEMVLDIPQNMSKEGQTNHAKATSVDASAGGAGTGAIEILTPLQQAASTYSAVPVCYDALSAPCWLTVPTASGSIAANSRSAVTAFINPQGFDPGVYTGAVVFAITPADASQSPVVVTNQVRMVVSPAGPGLQLSQSGLQFQIAQGAGSPPTQSIFVGNSEAGSQLTFMTATTGEPWLTVSQPTSAATSDTPVPISVQVDPTGLAPGTYTSRIDFSGLAITNGTQSVTVAFTVLPPAASTGLTVSSAALVFVVPAGGNNPPVQSLQLSNPSNQPLTVSTSTAFLNAGNWLNTYASGNMATAGKPLTQYVSVNAAGLDPGPHMALLTVNAAETGTSTPVEVLLIVQPASCTPTSLNTLFTNLEGGFTRTAGVPVPIDVLVVDGCGTPLTSGSVAVYFGATGDTSVSLTHVGNGHWAGTWLPRLLAGGPAEVGVMAASGGLTGSSGVVGTLTANLLAPIIAPEGVTNSASLLSSPVAPGSLITIAGMNLATTPDAAPTDGSAYPSVLSGSTQVFMNGEALPLITSASGSISAIVPYDVPIAATQQLIVYGNGTYSLPQPVVVSPAEPAIFSQDGSGSGAGLVQEIQPDGSQILNTPATPSTAGDSIAIFAAGLGVVNPNQMAGTPVAAPQTTATVNPVTVTIGGQPAVVSFAGLSPVMIGWYEVDVIVPPGITPGPQVPVIISAAGIMSVPLTIAVQ